MKYTEKLYKKDIHDPDTHNGMIAHLEPDILECKVKWALGGITMNKASGGDRMTNDFHDGCFCLLWSWLQVTTVWVSSQELVNRNVNLLQIAWMPLPFLKQELKQSKVLFLLIRRALCLEKEIVFFHF